MHSRLRTSEHLKLQVLVGSLIKSDHLVWSSNSDDQSDWFNRLNRLEIDRLTKLANRKAIEQSYELVMSIAHWAIGIDDFHCGFSLRILWWNEDHLNQRDRKRDSQIRAMSIGDRQNFRKTSPFFQMKALTERMAPEKNRNWKGKNVAENNSAEHCAVFNTVWMENSFWRTSALSKSLSRLSLVNHYSSDSLVWHRWSAGFHLQPTRLEQTISKQFG